MRWLSQPPVDGPESTVLLRLMAGGVFFWEGILKFVYVNRCYNFMSTVPRRKAVVVICSSVLELNGV